MSAADIPSHENDKKAPFILNGFAMFVVGHISAGLCAIRGDQAHRRTTLDYWLHLARLLDEGGFDSLSSPDALGQLDVYQGSADASLRTAAQSPVDDPLLLVSALAAATKHLGFGITVSTTYEQPYLLARKFTTLDHLTDGRIAWNIVTSMLESAARNLGLEGQIDHDQRYERAQEFLEVTYKMWEGSWEEGAVVRDAARGIYTDPARVHPIATPVGITRFRAPISPSPAPQRTPVLYQAGTSPAGQAFAARNAEVIFLSGTGPKALKQSISDIRAQASAFGRDPNSLKFITAITVVTAPTDQEHRRSTTTYSPMWTGMPPWPCSRPGPESTGLNTRPTIPWEYIETNASRSALSTLTDINADRAGRSKKLPASSGSADFIPRSSARPPRWPMRWSALWKRPASTASTSLMPSARAHSRFHRARGP